MAFDIFIMTSDSALSDRLINALDEQGIRVSTPLSAGITTVDEESYHLKAFKKDMAAFFDSLSPNMVVNLLPADQKGVSKAFAKQTYELLNLTRARNIVFLQESRHYGLSKNSNHSLHSLMADIDKTVLAYERAILLRRGLLLDDTHCGMLYQMCHALFSDSQSAFSDSPIATPVSIGDLADVLCAIVLQALHGSDNWGEYAYSSADTLSEVELADVLTRLLRKAITQNETLKELVYPSILAEAHGANGLDDLTITASADAKRLFDSDSVLNDRRLSEDFGIQRTSWRDNLGNRAIRIFKAFALEKIARDEETLNQIPVK